MLGALTYFSGNCRLEIVYGIMMKITGVTVIGDDPVVTSYNIDEELCSSITAQLPYLSNGEYYVYFQGTIEYRKTFDYNIREFEPEPTILITHINFVYQKEPAYELSA